MRKIHILATAAALLVAASAPSLAASRTHRALDAYASGAVTTDRSGAYYCRYVARRIVQAGLAKRAEVQVSYAIGRAKPMSIKVDTFGTGDEARAVKFVYDNFDFRPANIIRELDLLRPIYRQTTNYGHFGKAGLPWEKPVPVAV